MFEKATGKIFSFLKMMFQKENAYTFKFNYFLIPRVYLQLFFNVRFFVVNLLFTFGLRGSTPNIPIVIQPKRPII